LLVDGTARPASPQPPRPVRGKGSDSNAAAAAPSGSLHGHKRSASGLVPNSPRGSGVAPMEGVSSAYPGAVGLRDRAPSSAALAQTDAAVRTRSSSPVVASPSQHSDVKAASKGVVSGARAVAAPPSCWSRVLRFLFIAAVWCVLCVILFVIAIIAWSVPPVNSSLNAV